VVLKSTLGLFTLAAAGLFLLPAIAKAQAVDGAFVNANLGRASLGFGLIDGNDTSYGVKGGYRWAVSPGALIGFEAGYVDFGGYSALTIISTTTLPPVGGPPAEIETYPAIISTKLSGWTLGANARFNFSPNWYVGGRAGFLRARVNTHTHTTGSDDPVWQIRNDFSADGWYAGAGFGYDVSKNFGVGLNYDYYRATKQGSRIAPDVVSVSGEYRF
jgi:OmpA-OmpF porin, OOP family